MQRYFGCRVEFGADVDEMVFDGKVRELHLVSADPYLNKALLRVCEEALSRGTSAASPLRVTVENAIAPLLPHGTQASTLLRGNSA